MNNREGGFMILGSIIASAISIVIAANTTIPNSLIKSGEQIIIDNASYVCTKTNDLNEGVKDAVHNKRR